MIRIRGQPCKVVGLTHSDGLAKKIAAAGAEVLHGSIEDLEILRQGAAAADGIIHLTFIHDFSQYVASCETDRRAIEAMGEALAGTGKPLVIMSGMMFFPDAPSRSSTEEDPLTTVHLNNPRAAGEQVALALVNKNVHVSIIHLPPTVHGMGDGGFMKMIVDLARNTSYSGYVGEGTNHWPAVHVHDAARLYRLGLEGAPLGSILHAVAEGAIPFRGIAGAIGKSLGVEIGPQSIEKLGLLAFFINRDNPTSSKLTSKALSWTPKGIGLLADIKDNYCEA